MKFQPYLHISLTILVGAMLFSPINSAAMTQENAGDKIAIVDAYGDDACPQSTDDTIVVCRRFDEAERYRIPENLRGDPNAAANQSWTNRVRAIETAGATGPLSCSANGPGGYTGCLGQMIDNAYRQRAQGPDAQTSRLIEQERAGRLSNIEAEAAAMQAREDEIARELEESREMREAAAAQMQADAQASGASLETEGLDPLPQPAPPVDAESAEDPQPQDE